MGSLLYMTGKRFGRLQVVERVGTDKFHNALWLCKCDCGETTKVTSHSLKTGHTKSCGCLMRDMCGERSRTHGGSQTRLYHLYHSIKDRCENKNCPAYKHYGGRGISLCEEWQDWETFYEWAIKSGYKQGLSIDRIDVNGNYEPSNCRWTTHQQQMRNTRKTRHLTYNGITKPLIEWCEEYGIDFNRASYRYRKGWTNPQEILFGKKKGEYQCL